MPAVAADSGGKPAAAGLPRELRACRSGQAIIKAERTV
jgi:hypothetical protein